jgi:hypothetical protein
VGANTVEFLLQDLLILIQVKKGHHPSEMEEEIPKRNFVKLGNRKQKVKHEQWKKVQRNNKRTFIELSKWLDQSSNVSKATSVYLLECQVKVNSQLFRAHFRDVVKDSRNP